MNSPNFIIFPIFQVRKWIVIEKKDVGAEIRTLMSISDRLGPSIFHRKMERTGPMREKMDGMGFISPPESAFQSLMFIFKRVPFCFCTLISRLNNYVSRQEEGINRKNKITKGRTLLRMILTSHSFVLTNSPTWFRQQKVIQSLPLLLIFP